MAGRRRFSREFKVEAVRLVRERGVKQSSSSAPQIRGLTARETACPLRHHATEFDGGSQISLRHAARLTA